MDRPPPSNGYVPSRSVQNEPDPEWRQWFAEVERRRREAADPKRRRLRFSTVEKEGQRPETVVRQEAKPALFSSLIRKEYRKTGRALAADHTAIEDAWKRAVGDEIAAATAIHSFRNGVLTIAVSSSSLLQEIRQFHQKAILHDLRDIWPAKVALVTIKYTQGQASDFR